MTVDPQSPRPRSADTGVPIDLATIVSQWCAAILKRRRLFLSVLVGITLASTAVAFALPRRYYAQALVLPSRESSAQGLLSRLQNLAGIDLGLRGGGTTEIYPTVARSRRIITNVLDAPFGSGSFEGVLLNGRPESVEAREETIQFIRDNLRARQDLTAGFVSVEFGHENPEFAAALVNEILRQMETFFGNEVESAVHNQRLMIERRMEEVADTLRESEQSLVVFRENNRAINSAPALLLEEERLRRSVEIQSAVYIELNRQYELIKIEEIGEQPVMNILDHAAVPTTPTLPVPRAVVVLSGFFSAMIAAGLVVRYLDFVVMVCRGLLTDVRS